MRDTSEGLVQAAGRKGSLSRDFCDHFLRAVFSSAVQGVGQYSPESRAHARGIGEEHYDGGYCRASLLCRWVKPEECAGPDWRALLCAHVADILGAGKLPTFAWSQGLRDWPPLSLGLNLIFWCLATDVSVAAVDGCNHHSGCPKNAIRCQFHSPRTSIASSIRPSPQLPVPFAPRL